ncbi:GntR family transcriptional regulator, partial [Salmonella enterica]|uniref:GntR family transcriptional regulator n=1 Tax=Salmonella enterica TaxID=28901 RepID=UPI00109DECF5
MSPRPPGLERRIRLDLEAKIRSGAWRPGDRVPTEAELMAVYGCARMTVSKALSALAEAGLV